MQSSSQSAVMNFLNEVAERYPSAISLASGRPTDVFLGRLDPMALLGALQRYERHRTATLGSRNVMTALLQYGRTAGMIEALVAAQIANDESVSATADRLIVTSGCQEALALCIAALCPDYTDVALVCNPTYIGATGAANASRVMLSPLTAADGDIASSLAAADEQLHRKGQRARVVYLIPEFDNPTGHVIDRAQRLAILRECSRRRIVVLEDNPYGMFRFDGDQVPPMASLDEAGSVIYLSTYSKTLCPGLRIGSLVLPDTLFGDRSARLRLFEDLTQRKSFLTVNTSQIAQAMVAGFLLEQDCSLRRWVQPPLSLYRENRDTMLKALARAFGSSQSSVRWNRPDGGFFLVLDVPFHFDADSTSHCALEYGVIPMPMAFFALDASQDYRIRLAFSAVNAAQIDAGINALGRYVHMRMDNLP
jgi:(S)-3,5-dihydroxyphenylglycine transaminase